MSAERFYGGQARGGTKVGTPRGKSGITVSVTGLREIDVMLKRLSADARTKVIKKAMNKALSEMRDDARRRVYTPTGTGQLRGAISRRVTVDEARGIATGKLYVQQRGKRGAPHAHLVEFGTGERFAPRGWTHKTPGRTYVTVAGQSFGRMPKGPFMQPAFDENKTAVPRTFRKALRDHFMKKRKSRSKKA